MKQLLNFFKIITNSEIRKKRTFILSICIPLLTCYFFAITNIKGLLIILIYIVSVIPLIIEFKEIGNSSERNSCKKDISKKSSDFSFLFRPKYIIILGVFLFFSLSSLYLPNILLSQMNDYSESQKCQADLAHLTDEILLNSTNDYNKTSILYKWTNIKSGNIIATYSKIPIIQIYPLHIYLTEPYYCIRLNNHENPEWVTKSRCGACDEFSLFFMVLAENANLTVRSVHNHGYDHNWDEVLINDEWIIVDPSMSLFNVSPYYYENNLNWVSTYIFAVYPNGAKEDITERYTNRTNLTLIVLDENRHAIENASIFLLSNNHPKHKEINTTFQSETNSEGKCLIKVGGGKYTIIAEKVINGVLQSNKTTLNIPENINTTQELVLKNDVFYWANNFESSIRHALNVISFAYSLVLWIVWAMYLELKRKERL